MKFRKKPVVIEAFCVADEPGPVEVPSWFISALRAGDAVPYAGYIEIRTLEGVMRANVGDWIIKGIKGELYPCKNDIFEATYEPCDASAIAA